MTAGLLDEEAVGRWRPQFPILAKLLYFNSCSLGAMPVAGREAVQRFLDLWASKGGAAWYEDWWAELESLRGAYARHIGASADEVALAPSVSSALAAVAGVLDHERRPAVVLSDLDFPTLGHQWLARRDAGAALEVRFARSPDRISVPPEAFAAQLDEHTALLATSHVFYTSGQVQPLASLAQLAHAHGAWLLVDAYQSVGSLPVDVGALDVDFLVGGSLKWLVGGPGMAFLYVRRELVERLRPSTAGWWADERPFDFDVEHFRPAHRATRFEAGTLSVAAAYAARAGADLISEVGVEGIRSRISHLTDLIVQRAGAAGFTVRSPLEAGSRGGIVMLEMPEPQATVAELARRGVVVDYRPGRVRISPHFYNTPAEIDALFFELESVQADARSGKLRAPEAGVGAAPRDR